MMTGKIEKQNQKRQVEKKQKTAFSNPNISVVVLNITKYEYKNN